MRRAVLIICLFCCLTTACRKEHFQHVVVYFTADTNGFYSLRSEPGLGGKEAGGYGVLKNFLDTLQEPYLLFDGGNWFGASAEGIITKGAFITPFLKNIPYTAATVSAADFAYGWPSLRTTLREVDFPFVASNLRLENKLPWPLHDYQIRTVGNIKIGIFGLVSLPAKDTRLQGITALDPVQIAQEMVSLFKEKKVDYIILLSSLGTPQDNELSDLSLAQEVDGIDLILSSNQSREQAETEEVNHTYIVYPGAGLDSLAKITISFDKTKQVRYTDVEDIILLKETYGEDENLALTAEALRKKTETQMNKILSFVPQMLVNDPSKPSPLGTLLAQCLHAWAKLDGALLNGAAIRRPLLEGDLTENDLYKMYPYGDNITFLTMRGSALKQALQSSLNADDNFPQLAGMSVYYRNMGIGKMITKIVLANGKEVKPQNTYRLAVTDHVLAGGFGHDDFINSLEFKNTFVEARQIMRQCFSKQKEIVAPKEVYFKEEK